VNVSQAILKDRRVLVVEDDFLIAEQMRFDLEAVGAVVIGPVPSVERAMKLLQTEENVDAGVLDINLAGEKVFPVADALNRRNIRFIFATGYDASNLPTPYRDIPRFEKPVDVKLLALELNR
jgi:CheY-like chemotaxis protein